ncbi:hypothetical protein [Mesorhizobium sp.]|nr:hypothetical protein [Mesorhizobium sp.]
MRTEPMWIALADMQARTAERRNRRQAQTLLVVQGHRVEQR